MDLKRFEHWQGGDCYAMATALHRKSGWPIHAIIETSFKSQYIAICHAYVVAPDGHAYDALGKFDPELKRKSYTDLMEMMNWSDDHILKIFRLVTPEVMLTVLAEQWGTKKLGCNWRADYDLAVPRAQYELEGPLAKLHRDWLIRVPELS